MPPSRYWCRLLAFLLIALPQTVPADSRLRYQGADGSVATFYIHQGQVRLENAAGEDYALFDAGTETLTLVAPTRHRYTVVDVARLARWRDQAQQDLATQLERLPPSQRRELEGLLEAPGAAADQPAPPRLAPTGRSDRVAGYRCREYRLHDRLGELSRLCLAAPGELPIPADDARTLQAMMRSLHQMAAALPGQHGVIAMDTTALEGVPLWVREAGQTGPSARLQAADTVPAAPGRFQVPERYRPDHFGRPSD